jgi:hypothetical protein
MSATRNQIALAKEIMANLKIIGLTLFLSVLLLSVLYFLKQPAYITARQQEIESKANTALVENSSGEEEPNKYEALRRKLAVSGEQGAISGRSMKEVSEYDNDVVLGESIESINESRKRNFFNDITNKSLSFFIFITSFLIIVRYLTLGFRWVSRTAKL